MNCKYVFVILKTSESAPKAVVKDLERKIPISTNPIDRTVAKHKVFVKMVFAFLFSLLLLKIEYFVAPPIPSIKPLP